MIANTDRLQGRWPELRGQLRHRWSKLTDGDIATLSGKQQELAVALRRRYGYAEGQAVMEIHRWITDYDRDIASTRK